MQINSDNAVNWGEGENCGWCAKEFEEGEKVVALFRLIYCAGCIDEYVNSK